MYRLLKVNTTSAYPIVCWIEDAVKPRTGKTGLSPIISFSKNGAGFSAGHVNSGAMDEVGLGWYKYTPDNVDTNTQGVLIMNIASGTNDIPKVKDDVYFVDANYGEDEFSTRIAALAATGAAMTLTSAYDAAKTAASATAVAACTQGTYVAPINLSKADIANAMKDQDVHLTALATGSVAKLLDDDIAAVPASTWNVPYDNQTWATKAWANVILGLQTILAKLGFTPRTRGGVVYQDVNAEAQNVDDKSGYSLSTTPLSSADARLPASGKVIATKDDLSAVQTAIIEAMPEGLTDEQTEQLLRAYQITGSDMQHPEIFEDDKIIVGDEDNPEMEIDVSDTESGGVKLTRKV